MSVGNTEGVLTLEMDRWRLIARSRLGDSMKVRCWHQAVDRATLSQPIITMPRALKPHSGDT
jgi:hypothetical protein